MLRTGSIRIAAQSVHRHADIAPLRTVRGKGGNIALPGLFICRAFRNERADIGVFPVFGLRNGKIYLLRRKDTDFRLVQVSCRKGGYIVIALSEIEYNDIFGTAVLCAVVKADIPAG